MASCRAIRDLWITGIKFASSLATSLHMISGMAWCTMTWALTKLEVICFFIAGGTCCAALRMLSKLIVLPILLGEAVPA